MKLYKYTAVFTPEPGEDEVYNVTFPALPEIATFGESLAEAHFMAQDALELVVLSRLEEGEHIPSDKKPKRLPKGAIAEEILVTISHEVKTTPTYQRCQSRLRLKREMFFQSCFLMDLRKFALQGVTFD